MISDVKSIPYTPPENYERATQVICLGALAVLAGIGWAIGMHNFDLIRSHTFTPMDLVFLGGALSIGGYSRIIHKERYKHATCATALLGISLLLGMGAVMSHQYAPHALGQVIVLGVAAKLLTLAGIGLIGLDAHKKKKFIQALVDYALFNSGSEEEIKKILRSDLSLLNARYSYYENHMQVENETLLHFLISLSEKTHIDLSKLMVGVIGPEDKITLDSKGRLPLQRVQGQYKAELERAFAN